VNPGKKEGKWIEMEKKDSREGDLRRES